MEQSIITTTLLPLALAVIMLGMGLDLVPNDFRRILRYPKAVTVGLLNQIVLLPLIAFAMLYIFPLRAELAVGLMILAACPGGPTSNLITHLAKGDTALSVSLTAFSTVISMFTIPFIVNFSIVRFMPAEQIVTLPLAGTILSLLAIAILPITLGMLIRRFSVSLAQKADRPVRVLSAVFLVLIIAGAVLKEKAHLPEYLALVGPAALTLNVLTLAMGYLTAKLFSLSHRQSLTVSIEAGIQNATLAIAIAATMLHNAAMAVPPAIYSLIMFFTAGIIISLAFRKRPEIEPAAA